MNYRVVIRCIYNATQLQFSQNNFFSITMQLYYNYTHDVILMSLIVIHILKFNT
jgi:hypothetical protein